MKHIGNDLCHIAFAMLVLWCPSVGVFGYIVSGIMIGLLIELKEENSNILDSPFKEINWRDVLGYAFGGFIIGLIVG